MCAKQCMKSPRDELSRIESLDRIWDFVFRQSRISGKNMVELSELAESEDTAVSRFATVVLELARVRPFRRRRFRGLQKAHPELWQRLRDAGIREPCEGEAYWEPGPEFLALLGVESELPELLTDFDPDEDIPF
jgi:hypothetical protein